MKAMVVYDSNWGNTEKVALAIARGMGESASASQVPGLSESAVDGLDLLVIGSPVIGGKPSKAIQDFLTRLATIGGRRPRLAAFDTRLTMKFVQRFGYAAVKMHEQWRRQSETVVSDPMGFIVKGRKGPLEDGELERAEQWGRSLSRLA